MILAVVVWAQKWADQKTEMAEMKLKTRGIGGFSPFSRKRSGSGEMGTGKSASKDPKIESGARRTVGAFENGIKNVPKIAPE